ncbi:hypothetical protein Mal64_24620 [Pseudobythopirellula maris]|uniref:Uncharacterized protein n=1 Tax=Pseudobythopirellula maris TaxID=2527991 RepID=A0A5C5ZQ82_9BACT|nr:hypothetical protein Mal64_24620 [Pseudobythopirellula maris]
MPLHWGSPRPLSPPRAGLTTTVTRRRAGPIAAAATAGGGAAKRKPPSATGQVSLARGLPSRVRPRHPPLFMGSAAEDGRQTIRRYLGCRRCRPRRVAGAHREAEAPERHRPGLAGSGASLTGAPPPPPTLHGERCGGRPANDPTILRLSALPPATGGGGAPRSGSPRAPQARSRWLRTDSHRRRYSMPTSPARSSGARPQSSRRRSASGVKSPPSSTPLVITL